MVRLSAVAPDSYPGCRQKYEQVVVAKMTFFPPLNYLGVFTWRAAISFLSPLCRGPELYCPRCERSGEGQKKQWQQEPPSVIHRVLHLPPIAGDQ